MDKLPDMRVRTPAPGFLSYLCHTMSRKSPATYVAGLAVALAAVLGAGYAFTGAEAAPQTQFRLLDGSTRTTADLKGKVTLVNFWATSCVTCMADMPKVVETYRKFHGQGYDTVAVAMSYDRPDYVLNYARSRQLPFTVAIDGSGAVAHAWNDVQFTPTTFLVDQDGHIVKRFVGEIDFAELDSLVGKLLARTPQA